MNKIQIIAGLFESITGILSNILSVSEDTKVKKSIAVLKKDILLLETEWKKHDESIDHKINILNDKFEKHIKEELNKKKGIWLSPKIIKYLIFIVIILGLLTVSWFAIKPNFYRTDLNKLDVNSLSQIKRYDSIFINSSVKDEINIEFYKYDELLKKAPANALELQKNLISKIEKRTDDYLKEMEKEHNRLMRNIVIINLIGRYTIIISCILAFALIIWRLVKKENKDDFFE
jgi:hypothetical protein